MKGQGLQNPPMRAWQRVRARVMSISTEKTTFKARGFSAPNDQVREHLEAVGRTFLIGYHAALNDEPVEVLGARLREVDLERRGFAFEGAAMGLAFLDRFSLPGNAKRIPRFLNTSAAHSYMIHVGVGWAVARIPWGRERAVSRLDPLLRWLAVDGYGFHEGFFRFDRYAAKKSAPRMFGGYWSRAFDQGFGRSMWFVMGTQVGKIADLFATFDANRRGDLWSGVGLAATYAGGGGEGNLELLCNVAEEYLPCVGQGSAFAVKARQRAGNPTANMHRACEMLCGMSADEATGVVDEAMQDLPEDGEVPSFEVWRQRIQAKMRVEAGAVK